MKLTPQLRHLFLFLLVPAVLAATFGAARAQERLPYLDNQQPVEARVDDLLSRLTLEEKDSLVLWQLHFLRSRACPGWAFRNCGWTTARWACARRWASVFANMNRTDDFATAMPATLGLAATFNTNLANAYGTVIGQEAEAARQKHHARAEP